MVWKNLWPEDRHFSCFHLHFSLSFTWHHEQFHSKTVLPGHYFPLIYLFSKITPVIALCFVALSNSCYRAFPFWLFLFLTISLSQPAARYSSSCHSFLRDSNPPPNSGIYFLSATLCPRQNSMLITHTFTLSRCLQVFSFLHRDSLRSPFKSVTNQLQLCTFLGPLCMFLMPVERWTGSYYIFYWSISRQARRSFQFSLSNGKNWLWFI